MQSAYLIALKRYLGFAPTRNTKRKDQLELLSSEQRMKVGFSFAAKNTLVTLSLTNNMLASIF